ncbi:hypothetical protein [Hymenobacter chitinivorans]|uniref:Uncharacterized protein n=1 Tax=Hymenobacter chitinivorans DSM 11115 TaxID=1121954 RepID=A0A2M9BLD4_9BACT|nr:hypothetical protein [Hymenobacter chitinivorans]PJJ58741.1 hypothetical protein CLV45_0151 [Hymenobacter chitinivorans DSM 11115]
MENQAEKQARTLVEQWLLAHPERLQNRRRKPEDLLNWKRAAIRSVRQGNPYDVEDTLRWLATQAEGAAMED